MTKASALPCTSYLPFSVSRRFKTPTGRAAKTSRFFDVFKSVYLQRASDLSCVQHVFGFFCSMTARFLGIGRCESTTGLVMFAVIKGGLGWVYSGCSCLVLCIFREHSNPDCLRSTDAEGTVRASNRIVLPSLFSLTGSTEFHGQGPVLGELRSATRLSVSVCLSVYLSLSLFPPPAPPLPCPPPLPPPPPPPNCLYSPRFHSFLRTCLLSVRFLHVHTSLII